MSKIKKYIQNNKYSLIVLLVSLFFIVFCGISIKYEYFLLPTLILVLIAGYLLIAYTEKFFYFTCFIIPFSIEFRDIVPQTSVSFSIPSELILAGIVILFFVDLLKHHSYPKSIARHKISYILYFYIFWIILTTITSTMPLVSFKFLVAKLCFIVPAYFFFASLLRKDLNKAVTFLLCYATGLAIVVCMTTYKHIMFADVRKIAYLGMRPYYNDHTAYGAILAFFVPILSLLPFIKSLPKWEKVLSGILLIPILIGLYLSFSRAAWLSLVFVVGFGIIIIFKIKFKYLFATLLVMIFLFFSFQGEIFSRLSKNSNESSMGNFTQHIQSMTNITSDASNVERLNRWSSAISMFKEKPIFGFGPGTYQFQYAPYQNPKYRTIITTNAGTGGNAHSEYFGPMSEMGFMGLLIVLILVITLIVVGIKTCWNTKSEQIKYYSMMATLSLITYYFHGILNNFLDTEKLAVPVFGAMAIIVVCNILMKEEQKKNV